MVSVTHMHTYGSAIAIPMSPPSWTCLLPPTPPHPSRSSQSAGLHSQHHTASPTGCLFYMWQCICSLLYTVSIHPTLCLPDCVHQSVLYVLRFSVALSDAFQSAQELKVAQVTSPPGQGGAAQAVSELGLYLLKCNRYFASDLRAALGAGPRQLYLQQALGSRRA